jgi:hypothetical protein
LPDGARIVDTAPMSLDEIEAEFVPRTSKASTWRGCNRAIFRCSAR